jgi:hypothetical protein
VLLQPFNCSYTSSFHYMFYEFSHWAEVTSNTSTFVLAKSCVFGKQSKCPFLCEKAFLLYIWLHRLLYKLITFLFFSRTYKDNLPNSLSTVLSSPSYIYSSTCFSLLRLCSIFLSRSSLLEGVKNKTTH